jgi:hypothetical protein
MGMNLRRTIWICVVVVTLNSLLASSMGAPPADSPTKPIVLKTAHLFDSVSGKSAPQWTSWVDRPMYTRVVYCLERVPVVAKMKPELANVNPFKAVLSDDRDAIANLTMDDRFNSRGDALRHAC